MDIAPNFKVTDFQCHCAACAEDPSRPRTKDEVIIAVQAIRDFLGKPIVVSRGVSCEAHNKAVGGAEDSRHLPSHRDAVDIAVDNASDAYDIVQVAMFELNFSERFTAYEVCKKHVHLDMRPGPYLFIAGDGD